MRHTADQSPLVGKDQVYVTRTGKAYHPYWCGIVAAKCDSHPRGLLMIMADTVEDGPVPAMRAPLNQSDALAGRASHGHLARGRR